jgi:hypothetical protein
MCLFHRSSPDCCPKGAFVRFEKTQIGRCGGKALTGTEWQWICIPVPSLILLGFCGSGLNHAAMQRERRAVYLGRCPMRVPMVGASCPLKQGVLAM